jgi:hypothetical protein
MPRYGYGYTKENHPARVSPGMLDAETYGVKTNAKDMLRCVQANLSAAGLNPDLQLAIGITHAGYYRVGEMTQGLGWIRPRTRQSNRHRTVRRMALSAARAILRTGNLANEPIPD